MAYTAWNHIFAQNRHVPIEDLEHDRTLREIFAGNSDLGFEPFSEREHVVVQRRQNEDPIEYEVGSNVRRATADATSATIRKVDDKGEWEDSHYQDEPTLEGDLEKLLDNLLERQANSVAIRLDIAKPLLSLILDGCVRYGHETRPETIAYVLAVAESY